MNRIRNILVIVDPTAAEHPAVDKAARLAQALDARLELFICDTPEARQMRLLADRVRDPDRLLTINLKPLLEALAEPLRKRGIDVATECDFATRLDSGLQDRVKRSCADIVVKDTHHHSLAKRTFITNTDWQLIRCCPASLLLTKPKPWNKVPVIAAALDPGHVNDKPAALDERIMDHAGLLAARLQGSLHAIHAFIPVALAATATGAMPPMVATLLPEAMEEEKAQKRQRLSELLAPHGVTGANIHVDLGVASEVIPETAGQIQADIVAMGAVSRRAFARMLVGNTAERVLESIPADILVIKPPNFAELLPF